MGNQEEANEECRSEGDYIDYGNLDLNLEMGKILDDDRILKSSEKFR